MQLSHDFTDLLVTYKNQTMWEAMVAIFVCTDFFHKYTLKMAFYFSNTSKLQYFFNLVLTV